MMSHHPRRERENSTLLLLYTPRCYGIPKHCCRGINGLGRVPLLSSSSHHKKRKGKHFHVTAHSLPIPMPTTIRPASRTSLPSAAPITIDPTVKTTLAAKMTGLRPNRSIKRQKQWDDEENTQCEGGKNQLHSFSDGQLVTPFTGKIATNEGEDPSGRNGARNDGLVPAVAQFHLLPEKNTRIQHVVGNGFSLSFFKLPDNQHSTRHDTRIVSKQEATDGAKESQNVDEFRSGHVTAVVVVVFVTKSSRAQLMAGRFQRDCCIVFSLLIPFTSIDTLHLFEKKQQNNRI